MRIQLITIAAVVVGLASGRADEPEPVHRQRPFADFGYLPPAEDYSGRVFRLSQDYPSDKPSDKERPNFMNVNFMKDWRPYLLGVRKYCFANNIDISDDEDAFQVASAKPVDWFPMPWQHYGPFGREGIHGLTKEAPVNPRQLAWTQGSAGQTYAVAFFNRFGG